ncbi:SpoIID/LytB domain-containing protein [Ammoniphilus sp. YIM 78166]|uniref:SpoIID/LytB domain-containing protein n=1 Tax=Ammoniphilus sp. YIM 78166 TaxID=1644106 RepID=UPI00106F544B|nr:SpoIID/LytB domain-containing protein [Ammoniphilus sp. YIM 78166]
MLTKEYIARISKWGLALMLSTTLLFPTVSNANPVAQEPSISVKLVNFIGNPTRLTIELNGNYTVDGSSLTLAAGAYEIRIENERLTLSQNGQAYLTNQAGLTLKPSSGQLIMKINQRPYLGMMNFTLENGKTIRPVNTLPIEDYVKGVIPFEMPASWNIEALKAQAVAIRTYAIRRQNQVIDDTTNFQVYGGFNQLVNSTQAANETSGQVLTFKGEWVETVYSSSNGGKTEASGSLWRPFDYLLSQDDPYDPKNPWSISFSKQQIDVTSLDLSQPQLWWTTTFEKDLSLMNAMRTWLQQNGWAGRELKITSVPKFEWANVKTLGGRETRASIIIEFLVREPQGTTQQQRFERSDLSLVEVRKMVGGAHIFRSYFVEPVEDLGTSYTVKGNGFGHGVGMSQYGAKAMADQGLKMENILSFYYPGTSLSVAKPSTSLVVSQPIPVTEPAPAPTSAPPATVTAAAIPPAPAVKPSVTVAQPKAQPVVVSRSTPATVQGKIKSTVVVGVRKNPSFATKPHATVKNGQAVQILGKKDRWIQIKAGTVTGFIPDNFVQASK